MQVIRSRSLSEGEFRSCGVVSFKFEFKRVSRETRSEVEPINHFRFKYVMILQHKFDFKITRCYNRNLSMLTFC